MLPVLLLLLGCCCCAAASATAAVKPWSSALPLPPGLLTESNLNALLAQPNLVAQLVERGSNGKFGEDHAANVASVLQALRAITPEQAASDRQSLLNHVLANNANGKANSEAFTNKLNQLYSYARGTLLSQYFDRYLGLDLHHDSKLRESTKQYLALVLGVKALQAAQLNTAATNSSSAHTLNHLTLLGARETAAFKGYTRRTSTSTPTSSSSSSTPAPTVASTLLVPAAISWVDLGAVSPVLNQGSCGGCWAFSAMQVMESRLVAQHHGELLDLSVQQLLSCVNNGQNGCNGGDPVEAWAYAEQAGGLAGSTVYPFVNGKGGAAPTCSQSKVGEAIVTPAVSNSNNLVVLSSEDEMMLAVARGGPLAIAIATPNCFESYSSGVLLASQCACYQGPDSIDHAIVVVGYGTEDDATGTPYWLCKNSWGANWGMQGYVKLERGVNMCGLLTEPSYPEAVTYSQQCLVDDAPVPDFCPTSESYNGAGKTMYSDTNLTTGASLNACVEMPGGPYTSSQCIDTNNNNNQGGGATGTAAAGYVTTVLLVLVAVLGLGYV